MEKSPKIELSTEHADVYFKDGICYNVLNPNRSDTLESTQNHTRLVLEKFADRLPMRCILIVNDKALKSSNKEIRDYASGEEMRRLMKATALVITNTNSGIKMLGNLFLKLVKPAFPTKIFKNVEDAEKWLQQYK